MCNFHITVTFYSPKRILLNLSSLSRGMLCMPYPSWYQFNFKNLGSGCGTVGRAVAYDTRYRQFEYQHWQKFLCQ